MAGKPFSEDIVAQAFVFGIIVGIVCGVVLPAYSSEWGMLG